MAFYNSGFRKVLKDVARSKSNIRQNEGGDETLAAAVTLNTAKTGITSGQAEKIVANTAKVSYGDGAAVAANTAKVGFNTIIMVNTSSGWEEATADGGFTIESIDLRLDTVLDVKMEMWDSAVEALTPGDWGEFEIMFNMTGTAQTQYNVAGLGNVGLRNNGAAGVLQQNAYMVNTGKNANSSNFNPEVAVPLKMKASATFPNSDTLKMRFVITYYRHQAAAYTYE